MRERASDDFLRNEFLVRRTTFLRVSAVLLCLLVAVAITHAKKKPPTTPLDLNTATAEQLEQLPGIGPTAAQAIINFRTKSGRFQHVEDLLAIRGISQRKLDEIRPYIRVSNSTAGTSPAPKRTSD